MLARPLLIRADFDGVRFMVGASSTREGPPYWLVVVYIHACTYVTFDESLNRAPRPAAVDPG
jgi:hypothetical protein